MPLTYRYNTLIKDTLFNLLWSTLEAYSLLIIMVQTTAELFIIILEFLFIISLIIHSAIYYNTYITPCVHVYTIMVLFMFICEWKTTWPPPPAFVFLSTPFEIWIGMRGRAITYFYYKRINIICIMRSPFLSTYN